MPCCAVFKTHFNSILTSMPRFSKWTVFFRFPHHQTLNAFTFTPVNVTWTISALYIFSTLLVLSRS
jgi:hypothetical protein